MSRARVSFITDRSVTVGLGSDKDVGWGARTEAFLPESADWPAILDSLKTPFGGTKLNPEDLIMAIRTYSAIGQ